MWVLCYLKLLGRGWKDSKMLAVVSSYSRLWDDSLFYFLVSAFLFLKQCVCVCVFTLKEILSINIKLNYWVFILEG